MVLYADNGAGDGVVPTADTRDQISWRRRDEDDEDDDEPAFCVKQNGKLQYAKLSQVFYFNTRAKK